MTLSSRKPTEVRIVMEWSVFVAGAETAGQRRGARKKREFEGWLVKSRSGPG